MNTTPGAIAFVAAVALAASTLTFYSGFGLGTLLTPAFALLVPLPAAIAATAVVHGLNNVLKLFTLGRHADRRVVLAFGVPAVCAAALGAWMLTGLEAFGASTPVASYTLAGKRCDVTIVKLVVAGVIACFAALELWPRFEKLAFDRRFVPLGGLLSGFFGGLSGHQGALRTAFLARCELTKEQLVGTNAAIGTLVDAARLAVYAVAAKGAGLAALREERTVTLVIAGCVAAFVGTLLGAKLLRKVTLQGVKKVVGGALLLFAIALGGGVV